MKKLIKIFFPNFHFHVWSKWSDSVSAYYPEKKQYRKCLICNKVNTRSWKEYTNSVPIIEEEGI
jgi:hypothetical protein